MTKQYQKNS